MRLYRNVANLVLIPITLHRKTLISTTIGCLVMKRETNIVVWPVKTGATTELLHRLGTGATSKICISADRSKMGRASGKVMVRDATAVTMIRRTMAYFRGRTVSRTEGRSIGITSAVSGNDTLISAGGLPIDRLKTLVKLGGPSELPFAENGPKEKDGANGGSDND